MKTNKLIAVIIIFLFAVPLLNGEKRAKRKEMKELTNPDSPSYVPIPYPKDRKEIIADFRYYATKYSSTDEKTAYIDGDGNKPINDQVLEDLFKPNSQYKIGKILKVRNRFSKSPDEYSWLIHILEKDGSVIMKAAMHESGLYIGDGVIREQDVFNASEKGRKRLKRARLFIDKKDIESILLERLGDSIKQSQLKKLELVVFPSPKADFTDPIWELELTDGRIYYYQQCDDILYSVEKRIPWKKSFEGTRQSPIALIGHYDFLPDTVGDEIIVLKTVARK